MERRKKIIRVAAFESRSLTNGPGVRAVLWVQGCSRRCSGCFNPGFQPKSGGHSVSIREVITWIEAADGIEGITFSGGEPFDQAQALARVARQVQTMGFGVLVFSGYTYHELRQGRGDGFHALLAATDLLVAGPFEQGRPLAHQLMSSANQELVYITNRYRNYQFKHSRQAEFRITADGTVRTTGFPGVYEP